MAYEFRLPDVGEGVVEGEIVRWLVKEGETVSEDQPMVEVMTDKANVEIPSPVSGTILRCVGDEGDIVKVGDVMVTIGSRAICPVALGFPQESQRHGNRFGPGERDRSIRKNHN